MQQGRGAIAAAAPAAVLAVAVAAAGCTVLSWPVPHARVEDGVPLTGTVQFQADVPATALPTEPLAVPRPLASVPPIPNFAPLESLGGIGPAAPVTSPGLVPAGADRPYLVLEAVDPASGELLARKIAEAGGPFELLLARRVAAWGVVLQATAVTNGKVGGYLCATLAIRPSDAQVPEADMNPGTTALAFADALLAGARAEFDVDQGFRGFKSGQIARLVAERDASASAAAAAALWASEPLAGAADPSETLERAARAAEGLAQRIAGKAAGADRSMGSLVVAFQEALSGLRNSTE